MLNTIVSSESGIYAIRNTINNKVYVGSAVNFNKRFIKHKTELNNGKHHSQKLSRAWVKYGSEAFIFEILEIVEDKINLIIREQVWIDSHDSSNKGYNMAGIAGSALGTKRTPEQKERMSAIKRNQSPETRAKIGLAHKGGFRSEEMRKKISASLMGLIQSKETRLKKSLSATGKKKSPEAIAKSAAKRVGRKASTETRLLMSIAGKNRAPISEETREKLRITSTGRKRSVESIEKSAAAHRGRVVSSESKAKQSETYNNKSKEEKDRLANMRRGVKRTPEQLDRIRTGQLAHQERRRILKQKVIEDATQ